MTTTATLLDRLSQRVGDYLDITLTTALTTSTSVVSTNFGKYTNRDDSYNRYWLYVEDYANAAQYRRISDYVNSTTTATVLGANFVSDTANLATVQIHKYDRLNKIRALNQAARKIHPYLFRIITNEDLISNNALPNGRFTDWSVSTYPDYWRVTNATATKTTTISAIRGGSASVLLVASADNGYMACTSSITFPSLLDLQGRTVSFKAWAFPSMTANTAVLEIVTIQPDGTTQTLTSTTACPLSKWTLLELENQVLNDNLHLIQAKCKITTSGSSVYFANARLIDSVQRYVLPLDFQNPQAIVDRASIQITGQSDDYCDDFLGYAQFTPFWGWDTFDDSTTKYLTTSNLPSNRIIRLEGHAPLESNLDAATDTMTIEDPYTDLLIEYAAHLLFDMEAGIPSGQDRDFLLRESFRYRTNYESMRGSMKMIPPNSQTHFGGI